MTSNRILLNAEPFGFGPATAVAAIARELAAHDITIGYIGEGHTRDVQYGLPYADFYDLTNVPANEHAAIWAAAAKQYDVCLTAMDFGAAVAARAAGLRVIIYDALTWFWPQLPTSISQADLYLAQDFFGVTARIDAEETFHTTSRIVPPIVRLADRQPHSEHIVLNMGGLQNPAWDADQAAAYARVMINSVRAVWPKTPLTIATSSAVAARLDDPDVRTYSPHDMRTLFRRATLAIMTPGLGNIYDAAAYNLPTIWLPPANDSQGRQLELLRTQQLCDAAVDWRDIGQVVRYTDPQPQVLQAIRQNTDTLSHDSVWAARLHAALDAAKKDLAGRISSRGRGLLEQFGSDGAAVIAHEIITFLQETA